MKKTTAENDPQSAARLRELIAETSVVMITTVTPDGTLRGRPMFTQDIRSEGELGFITSDETGSVRDLAEEQAVNVSYADPIRSRYVSVSGNASWLHNPEKLHELWTPATARFFPKGLHDPHLALLRVRTESAEFWDAPSTKRVPLDDAGGRRPAPSGPTRPSPVTPKSTSAPCGLQVERGAVAGRSRQAADGREDEARTAASADRPGPRCRQACHFSAQG